MRRKRLLTFFALINVVGFGEVVVWKPSDHGMGAAAHSSWAIGAGSGLEDEVDAAALQRVICSKYLVRLQPVLASISQPAPDG